LLFVLVLCGSGIVQQAYNLIENSGTPLTRFSTLNFAGTGVTCTNDTGRTTCTINGTGISNYSQSFTSQTSVTLTHGLNTTAVIVQCFDGSANAILPSNINLTSVNSVTVTFGIAQTGSCNVNGAAGGSSSSVPFSGITSGTNTAAAMVVGTGASLNPGGSGVLNANQVNGLAVPASAVFVNTNGSAQFGPLTAAQATALLNIFTSTLQGLVPASGGGTTNFLRADGTFAAPPATGCAPSGSLTNLLTDNGSGGCSSNSNVQLTAGGILSKYDGLSTVGLGVPVIGWQSVLSNSSATSLVTLATSPAAGDYEIEYDLDLHTPCTTGTGELQIAFGFTGNSARTITSGGWPLTSTQTAAGGAFSGVLPIHVVSGNVTYTPTLTTACATGTATWDGDIWMVRVN
jgi:hypothetical protein